ncbi:MAG TPA: thioredoxin family protein [Nitrolancea sp.]|nr:thioredoxin family protein [Nitrolancea sp.]
MPIMSPEDQEYVRSLFAEKLTGDVTLRLYTQSASKLVVPGRPECPMCEVTQQLLEELVELSDKLTLEVHDFYAERAAARADGVEQIPTLVLEGANKGTVRFIGAPSGYEFATLLDDLIDLSNGTTSLEPESRDMLAALTEPVHIQVFVTPT